MPSRAESRGGRRARRRWRHARPRGGRLRRRAGGEPTPGTRIPVPTRRRAKGTLSARRLASPAGGARVDGVPERADAARRASVLAVRELLAGEPAEPPASSDSERDAEPEPEPAPEPASESDASEYESRFAFVPEAPRRRSRPAPGEKKPSRGIVHAALVFMGFRKKKRRKDFCKRRSRRRTPEGDDGDAIRARRRRRRGGARTTRYLVSKNRRDFRRAKEKEPFRKTLALARDEALGSVAEALMRNPNSAQADRFHGVPSLAAMARAETSRRDTTRRAAVEYVPQENRARGRLRRPAASGVRRARQVHAGRRARGGARLERRHAQADAASADVMSIEAAGRRVRWETRNTKVLLRSLFISASTFSRAMGGALRRRRGRVALFRAARLGAGLGRRSSSRSSCSSGSSRLDPCASLGRVSVPLDPSASPRRAPQVPVFPPPSPPSPPSPPPSSSPACPAWPAPPSPHAPSSRLPSPRASPRAERGAPAGRAPSW